MAVATIAVARRRRKPPHSPDTMTFRTILLATCMLVVPLLAMFSHLIPAEVRAAARRGFSTPSITPRVTAATASPVPPPPVTAPPARLEPLPRPADFLAAQAALPPAAAGAPPPAAAAGSTLLPVGHASAAAPDDTASAAPLVAQLADRTRQARDQQAREQQALEDRLTSLGALAIDCQPMPGAAGLHSCSCRVPVDATGQLQRVFQATGRDPLSATDALLEQVTAWRQRVALQPPLGPGADLDGPRAADRFR